MGKNYCIEFELKRHKFIINNFNLHVFRDGYRKHWFVVVVIFRDSIRIWECYWRDPGPSGMEAESFLIWFLSHFSIFTCYSLWSHYKSLHFFCHLFHNPGLFNSYYSSFIVFITYPWLFQPSCSWAEQARIKRTIRQNYEERKKEQKQSGSSSSNSVRCIIFFFSIKNDSNVFKEMSALSVTDQNCEACSQRGQLTTWLLRTGDAPWY